MTVRELREVLALMDDDTIVEILVESPGFSYCADAKEILIGTEPNKVCIFGEENLNAEC